jgi:hypothetical protein
MMLGAGLRPYPLVESREKKAYFGRASTLRFFRKGKASEQDIYFVFLTMALKAIFSFGLVKDQHIFS